MYEDLVRALLAADARPCSDMECPGSGECPTAGCLFREAADAIEELFRAAKAMHTWIFLNSYDEQEAYDECHLSDEMNVALGYGGQFELRSTPPKEET